MNIIFFHTNGIVPTAGGISRTTYNLLNLFRQMDHQVWAVGAKNIYPNAIYDEQQLFLPSLEQVDNEDNRAFMKDVITSNNIDIIINQAPFTPQVVSLLNSCREYAGVKVVSCYHNSILTPIYHYAYQKEYKLRKHGMGFLFWLLKLKPINMLLVQLNIAKYRGKYKTTAQDSDVVVLLCDGQVAEWERMSGMSSKGKIVVIPNYTPILEKNDTNAKKEMVLWVGTFDYSIKRPDLMLQIWGRIEDKHPVWSLYMLGDGPSLSEVKKLAQELKLKRVVFTGRVTPTTYYEQAQIQCVTSIHEAFPMVPLEAMQHGSPVIAFDSYTSAPLVIKDSVNGFLVKPFDTAVYAEKLSLLMSDNELRGKTGKLASKSVERFSEENVYKLWAKLFDDLNISK